jgi:hypothetical protein
MNLFNLTCSKKVKFSLLFLVAGLILVITGITLSGIQAANQPIPKWIISLGFFCSAIGLVNLVRYWSLSRNPTRARQAEFSEKDERNLMIRNQAGYSAYIISIIISFGALLIYSNLSQSTPGFDFLWFYLAFAALAPSVFYIVYLIWLQSHY